MTRRYKTGLNRSQGMLLPPCLDEYVSQDNPVRALDAYVDGLDLKALGFTHTEEGISPGQPAYHPASVGRNPLHGSALRP